MIVATWSTTCNHHQQHQRISSNNIRQIPTRTDIYIIQILISFKHCHRMEWCASRIPRNTKLKRWRSSRWHQHSDIKITVGYHVIEVGGTTNILNGGFLFNDAVAQLKHRSSMALKIFLKPRHISWTQEFICVASDV